MSLDAMAKEIRNQLDDLPKLALDLGKHRCRLDSQGAIFTGSGDSYAASLFASELSDKGASAEDPYELYRNLSHAYGKTVILVSVSGRTLTNISLARKLRTIARKTIAITSNADSPLAIDCSEILLLSYRKAPTLTAGTVSFTASLLACASLVGKIPRSLHVKRALDEAVGWAEKVKLPSHGFFLFTGSGLGYALAQYGACKVQEVLGVNADATYPEQLGHARLFSLVPKRDVIVSILSKGDEKTRSVAQALSKHGFIVYTVEGSSRNPVIWSIEVSLHLQMLAYSLARKRHMRDCAFVAASRKLALSSSLIY